MTLISWVVLGVAAISFLIIASTHHVGWERRVAELREWSALCEYSEEKYNYTTSEQSLKRQPSFIDLPAVKTALSSLSYSNLGPIGHVAEGCANIADLIRRILCKKTSSPISKTMAPSPVRNYAPSSR